MVDGNRVVGPSLRPYGCAEAVSDDGLASRQRDFVKPSPGVRVEFRLPREVGCDA